MVQLFRKRYTSDELHSFCNATQVRSRYAAARSGYVSVHVSCDHAHLRTDGCKVPVYAFAKAVQFCYWDNIYACIYSELIRKTAVYLDKKFIC